MAEGDDIEDRLIQFAVSVMDLTEGLPTTFAGKHTGNSCCVLEPLQPRITPKRVGARG